MAKTVSAKNFTVNNWIAKYDEVVIGSVLGGMSGATIGGIMAGVIEYLLLTAAQTAGVTKPVMGAIILGSIGGWIGVLRKQWRIATEERIRETEEDIRELEKEIKELEKEIEILKDVRWRIDKIVNLAKECFHRVMMNPPYLLHDP